MTARYSAEALRSTAAALLAAAGMDTDMARDVAAVLVEGDLLGHDTHGLALLAPYLAELDAGSMRKAGSYSVLNERAAAALWDGERLPGPWLTLRAIDDAIARARHCGTGTIVIRRSHHIACLAAYLTRATEQGFVLLVELLRSEFGQRRAAWRTQAAVHAGPAGVWSTDQRRSGAG